MSAHILLTKKSLSKGGWGFLFCILYAACLLFYTIAPGDGGWMLYAKSILHGNRIYSELNLNQQPLFILYSQGINLIFGDRILLQKLGYLTTPIFYSYFLFKIVSLIAANGLVRGFTTIALFFIAITFVAYRFDDYHAFCGVLLFASLYLSLKFAKHQITFTKYAGFQSLVIALLMITRLTDGIFLAMAVFCFTVSFIGFSRQLAGAVVFALFTFFVLLTISLLLLNESYFSWYKYTILEAAKIKGGMSLWSYPFLMLKKSIFLYMDGSFSIKRIGLILFSSAILWISVKNSVGYFKYFLITICFFGIAYGIFKIYPYYGLTLTVSLGVLVSFVIAPIALGWKIFFKESESVGLKQFLALIYYPFFLYLSGSLSSAGSFDDHFFPLTFLIIVLFLLFQDKNIKGTCKESLKYAGILFFLLLFIEAATFRTMRPYAWHSYNVPNFFERRVFVNDPVNGPHFLSRDLAELILPVCSEVKMADELLSIPFSFANYYCHKEPWKGYIQSFFDTSSAVLIDRLIWDINISPPQYIFYQRQLENLSIHEKLFNNNLPLRQRALDELIMRNINERKWKVVYSSDLYPPSVWLLIKTK